MRCSGSMPSDVPECALVLDLNVASVLGWKFDYELRKETYEARGGTRVNVREFLVEEY